MSVEPESEKEVFEERNRRFSLAACAAGQFRAEQIISSHALLIEVDLRLAFCAGAWLSVIVLACAAVEAQARQVTVNNYTLSAHDLFADNPELQWLRSLRNELVHAGEPGTKSRLWKIGGGDIGANHSALEEESTKAIKVMFKAIYARQMRKRTQT